MLAITSRPAIFTERGGRSYSAEYRAGKSLRDYRPREFDHCEFYCVWNGRVMQGEALDRVLPHDGDKLTYAPSLGATAAGLAAVEVAKGMFIEALIGAAIAAAVSAAISYALSLLIGVPGEPEDIDDEGAVFSPIRNTRGRGLPIPVIYGQHRHGGHVLNLYTTLDERGNTKLSMLLGVSHGRIEGIGSQTGEFDDLAHDHADLSSVKVNNNPLTSYSGTTVSFRPGEITQSVIPGFNNLHDIQAIESLLEQPLDANGNPASGAGDWYRHSTTQAVDRAVINIAHGGLYYATDKGKIKTYHVAYDVRYRLQDAGGGVPGPWFYVNYDRTSGTHIITANPAQAVPVWVEAKRVAAFSSAFELVFSTRDDYDIEVRRHNRDSTNSNSGTQTRHKPTKRNNQITLSSVDEIIDQALAYPGTALLAFRNIDIRQTGGATPNVTAIYKGKRVPVWDGVDPDNPVYAHKWSQNPAWISLDVCLNERYSMGAYLDDTDPDLETLLEWADYCDTLVDDGEGGTEALALYDAVIRGELPAWEMLQNISRTARCAPLISGRKIKFKVEKPRSRTQVFGMGNIREGSWSGSGLNTVDAPNQITVQYLSAGRDYAGDAATFELDEVLTNSEPLRRKSFSLIGITRPGQALREAKFLGLMGKALAEMQGFSCGLSALGAEAGDRIGMTHDVPDWQYSGRIATGSTLTSVVLDREVVLEAGTTYEVMVISNTDDTETLVVTSPAGTYAAGDSISVASNWSRVPEKHDPFYLGEEDNVVNDWAIVERGINPDLSQSVKVVTYDESPMTDSLTLGQIVEVPSVVALGDAHRIPSDATDVTLVADPQISRSGTVKDALRVQWAEVNEQGTRKREVFLRESADYEWRSAGVATGGELLITEDVEPGTAYDVAVVGVADAGDRGHPDASPQASLTYNPLPSRPVPPTNLALRRVGDVVTLSWDDPGVDEEAQPQNRHLAFYRVKRGSEWREAMPVADVKGNSVELVEWTSGGEHLLVKAIDTDGQESYTAAAVWTDLDPPFGATLALDRDERALGWPGTHSGTQVDSEGRLEVPVGQVGGIYQTPEIDLGSVKDWHIMISGTPVSRWRDLTSEASRIVIGAVTGGPFQAGETVTGGTSSATGTVLIAAADGALYLYIRLLTGTFQADETLTGGTSGATATSVTAALPLLLNDPELAKWTTGGPGDEDHSNATIIELMAGEASARDLQSEFTQGVLRTRYLQVLVTLSTDDEDHYQPGMETLRITATEAIRPVDNLITAETDTSKSLRPDGSGGVMWV